MFEINNYPKIVGVALSKKWPGQNLTDMTNDCGPAYCFSLREVKLSLFIMPARFICCNTQDPINFQEISVRHKTITPLMHKKTY